MWGWLREHKGIQADTVAYNSMLSALGKNGRVDRALELFDDMQAKGVMLDKLTCDEMISLYQTQVWASRMLCASMRQTRGGGEEASRA